jgi:hypothetical protein
MTIFFGTHEGRGLPMKTVTEPCATSRQPTKNICQHERLALHGRREEG